MCEGFTSCLFSRPPYFFCKVPSLWATLLQHSSSSLGWIVHIYLRLSLKETPLWIWFLWSPSTVPSPFLPYSSAVGHQNCSVCRIWKNSRFMQLVTFCALFLTPFPVVPNNFLFLTIAEHWANIFIEQSSTEVHEVCRIYDCLFPCSST